MDEKPMFSNKNIVKYSIKYFVLTTLGAYIFNLSASMINQKSDVANLVGSALFAGLFVGTLVILKSDVTKLVKKLEQNKNKENE
jgi:uncharacterized membrane protein YqgA involved in biofilm formation